MRRQWYTRHTWPDGYCPCGQRTEVVVMTAALETPGMEGREAIGQWDWLRVVRRLRLGRRRTGLRATLLTLATYAKRDGSNIYPSVERLAQETEQGRRTVLRHLALLRDVYRLIGRVARGGGRGRRGVTSRYQLTVPEDLLDNFPMLGPDGKPPTAPDPGATGPASRR